MVTHRVWCPTKDLKPPSCIVSLRAGGQNVHKAASIPLVIHDTMGRSIQNVGLAPPVSTITPDLPGLPLPYFAYCK